MSQFPIRSNAPVINRTPTVQGKAPTFAPQTQQQQQQNPMQMLQQYQQMQDMFGGGTPNVLEGYGTGGSAVGSGAAMGPGLQASGATTAGIGMGGTGVGATAGPVVGTPLAAGGGGAAGGAGAGGGGSVIASAGPWAALAAAIYLNESQARDTGRRNEDDLLYARDLLTSNVVTQDVEAATDKMFGSGDTSKTINSMADFATLDLGSGFDNLKEGPLSGLFDLF